MKRTGTIITLLIIVIAFSAGIWYIYSKDKTNPVVFQTETASIQTIVKKTVATGNIVPKEEVLIKPNISGIIDEIFVLAGDVVLAGDLIAKVKVVPNINSLNSAKNNINSAKTQVETARLALESQKKHILAPKRVI
jgi:HlyD family secretion protein